MTRPSIYLGTFRPIWSNFEGILDEEVVKDLEKDKDSYALHAAWNYAGYVWFDPDEQKWHEQIWVYGSKVGELTGDSPTNVIAQALAKHGVT